MSPLPIRIPEDWLIIGSPLAALGWPLLLVAALMVPPLRRPAQRLAGWAALPALAVALLAPDATVALPDLMLGASLVLDASGRWLLLGVALVWLAAGWARAGGQRETPFALAFLLALSGAVWLTLANDLPSFLAATVLAGYPLYLLLGGGRAGRALVVLLLIGDLILLEMLLMLAKDVAALDFRTLREALGQSDKRDLLLVLALLGFGAKAGLMGLHYWIAPALVRSTAGLAPVLILFTLAAGGLPWLRLLPISAPAWPETAALLLHWLAPAASLWALAAGLLQRDGRAALGYAACALTALWLAVLGAPLSQAAADSTTAMLAPAMTQAGLGLGVLLLAATATPDRARRISRIAVALAAAVLALIPIIGMSQHVPLRTNLGLLVLLLGCPAVLLGHAVWMANHQAVADPRALRAAAALLAGQLGVAMLSAPLWWSAQTALLSVGLLAAGLTVATAWQPAVRRLPGMPPGDLLAPLGRLANGLLAAAQGLGEQSGQARDALQRALLASWPADGWRRAAGSGEALLRRWPVAIALVLLLSLMVGWLAVIG